jgi:hypothetical protein
MVRYNKFKNKILVPISSYAITHDENGNEIRIRKPETHFAYVPYPNSTRFSLNRHRLSIANSYGFDTLREFIEEAQEIIGEEGYSDVWHYINENPEGLDLYFVRCKQKKK